MTNERDPEASPQGADDERTAAPGDPAPAVEPQDAHPVPAADHWDPWAPPRPAEHTQPVDLSHTQEIDAAAAASAHGGPEGASPDAAPTQPVWAHEPTGWPAQPAAPGPEPTGYEPTAHPQQPLEGPGAAYGAGVAAGAASGSAAATD
ncbi:MAG TPA: hypothetical protein VFM86_09015, partial [Pedococcus sp.]|nr:hypothetical protein [Pedococcus sp.]